MPVAGATGATGDEQLRIAGGSRDASLHANVSVFDGRITWIGSFNLDPRSAGPNTELAVVIHSEPSSTW